MTNTVIAKVGDIIQSVQDHAAVTKNNVYIVTRAEYSEFMGSVGVEFTDNVGTTRCFWEPEKYTIIGSMAPPTPTTHDIHGQTVNVGDYVAFSNQNRLQVLEVKDISVVGVCTCRDVADDSVKFYGVFEERAILLKDYNK